MTAHHGIMVRSLMMNRLAVLTVFVLRLLAVTAPPVQAADNAPDAPAHNSSECISKLTNFVGALDSLLASNPPSLFPLYDLLKKYFPLERCDVEEAVKISRRSKFLSSVSESWREYVIVFSSASPARPHSGFFISFGLVKASGDSELPFAKVNH
jgi:hypothetical protein